MNENKIIQIPVEKLSVHPAIKDFPRLTPGQIDALDQSIKAVGLKDPLDVVADPDRPDHYLIIDGRHRYELMLISNEKIPCLVVEEKEPVTYAIEKAVQGRNLTKSGVAMLVFRQHPTLAKDSKARRLKNLKQGKTPMIPRTDLIGSGEIATFKQLAKRYDIPEEYFTILADFWSRISDEDWLAVEEAVFVGEKSLPYVKVGQAGKDATKGMLKREPNYVRVSVSTPGSLKSIFERWDKIEFDQEKRALSDRKFHEAYALMPEAHRNMIREHMQNWPLAERKAARQALNASLKKTKKTKEPR